MITNYFDKLRGTVIGEAYFRVSKHLSVPLSEVIRNKFNPDYRMLLAFYIREIKLQSEEQEKLNKTRKEGEKKNGIIK